MRRRGPDNTRCPYGVLQRYLPVVRPVTLVGGGQAKTFDFQGGLPDKVGLVSSCRIHHLAAGSQLGTYALEKVAAPVTTGSCGFSAHLLHWPVRSSERTPVADRPWTSHSPARLCQPRTYNRPARHGWVGTDVASACPQQTDSSRCNWQDRNSYGHRHRHRHHYDSPEDNCFGPCQSNTPHLSRVGGSSSSCWGRWHCCGQLAALVHDGEGPCMLGP